MLLDKGDHLQQTFSLTPLHLHMPASASAMQQYLLHSCKQLQAVFSILPDTISVSSRVRFSNSCNAQDAA